MQHSFVINAVEKHSTTGTCNVLNNTTQCNNGLSSSAPALVVAKSRAVQCRIHAPLTSPMNSNIICGDPIISTNNAVTTSTRNGKRVRFQQPLSDGSRFKHDIITPSIKKNDAHRLYGSSQLTLKSKE